MAGVQTKVWKCDMSSNIHTSMCLPWATIETILQWSWSVDSYEAIQRSLDGTYTRQLRHTFGIRWHYHQTNTIVYWGIYSASERPFTWMLRFNWVWFAEDNVWQGLLGDLSPRFNLNLCMYAYCMYIQITLSVVAEEAAMLTIHYKCSAVAYNVKNITAALL